MVPGLHVGNTLSHGLDDAGSLVSENNRERTLGVFT